MKPIILPAARDDILRQFRYYLVVQDKPEVAERFLSAVRRTVEGIIRTPQGGAPSVFPGKLSDACDPGPSRDLRMCASTTWLTRAGFVWFECCTENATSIASSKKKAMTRRNKRAPDLL